MTYFALTFVFLIQLAMAAGLVWAWSQMRAEMRRLEQKVAESLDEQDLMDFQDRLGLLLAQVKETGASIIAEIDRRRAGLEREGSRAREAEKRLASRIQAMEKAEDRLKMELEAIALDMAKKRPQESRKTSASKGPRPATAQPSQALEAPETNFKASYRIREFRPPEPQAPVSPTASRYLKVYELADKGLSKEIIAKESGYLPGEIELILNLRPKSGA